MGLRYLTLGAISAVLLSLAHGTWTSLSAQERFPAHPVHLIVPAPAGGSLDIGIRIIEPRLSALLGAPIVIVNRSGASGAVAMAAVASAPADGYTLAATSTSTLTFSTPLYHGMPLFADVLAEWFPEVPIIITKMGRGYSFIFEMALAVAYKHPNVYFDIVQAPPEHIERGVRELGADRIMFGTDWSPTWRAEAGHIYKKNLQKVETLEISEEAKDCIRWRTAAKLFRLDVAEGAKQSAI